MSATSPLGQRTPYPERYSPELLHPIPRAEGRRALGIEGEPPFTGVDLWNAWEVSWLDGNGKPVVATARLRIPAGSPNLIESKSLKLYLDSLHATRHASPLAVEERIAADLTQVAGTNVDVALRLPPDGGTVEQVTLDGTCIDDVEVTIETYEPAPELLDGSTSDGVEASETLYSHLFKSNCPVTGQPDWATVFVRYRGPRIDRAALLRYLVSFRDHAAFHEHCVERIFVDLRNRCAPRALTVQALFTRRGGLDINPFRSDAGDALEELRTWRQ